MDSKNKKVIYGVVGIMTLSIMIIGGTVAYLNFKESNINSITGNMPDIGFKINVTKVTNVDDEIGLVPMSNNMIEKAVNRENVCVDKVGNAVCQVYKITVNNTSGVNIFVDGYITLTGGLGEPADYLDYKYNQDKTTMRWSQVFCDSKNDNKVSNCTTSGSMNYGEGKDIVLNNLGEESIEDDKYNKNNIKDSKLSVIQNLNINDEYYDVINRNYIRVSDHEIDNNKYTQDKDITSALVYNHKLDKNQSREYYFVVWLSENGQNQAIGDKENFFGGKVIFVSSEGNKITAKFKSEGEATLYSTIQDNVISDDTNIDFSKISSDENGKGVYQLSSTRSDDYPVYYYRGAVTNNNVKFANFCWKIVRTTETGGVKLIYNGSPDDSGGCTNTTEGATQLTAKDFNSNSSSPADVGYMYGTRYEYKTKDMSGDNTNYMYGKTVSYKDGNYTLETTKTGTWSNLWNGGLNSNHYTCFTESNTCSTVNYIYYTTSSTAYYIELTGGKKVDDALKEMTSESTNKHNSTIKTYIDFWYSEHMTKYTNFLEDTVWCNDRSIDNYNGWNPNGGNTTKYLYFSSRTRIIDKKSPSLTCSNENDKFTVNESNGNGKLTYPVGLLTGDEINYAGAAWNKPNSSYYLYTNRWVWSISPAYFLDNYAHVLFVSSTGNLYNSGVGGMDGVRPSISLRPGTKISTGDGSQSAPFEIKSE